jgi:acyl-CoA thioester hydrolase
LNELIKEYPVIIEIPIAWGDMDAFQHVNNIIYFKYFESARIAYFEKINFLQIMNSTGIGPILASTQCKYKIPLSYPDRISVGATVDTMGKDNFTMKYAVISHYHQKAAAYGEGMIVTFNYRDNIKTHVPDEIRKSIIELEKSADNEVKLTE